jgi:uncharacterized protein (TIGR00297 family)
MSGPRWLLALSLSAAVATLAYRLRSLSRDGAVAATVVGGIVFARGGIRGAATLLAFFATSSALSKLRDRRPHASGEVTQAKGGRRDVWQVLANGGLAALSITRGVERGGGAFVGALATASADTWGTEIGLLARRTPRSIVTWRTVPPGTSGGVTLEGSLAQLAGAAVIGITWWLFGGDRRSAWKAMLAGSVGALVDSVLGATLQAVYWCQPCGAHTEQIVHACGQPAALVRGARWMTNDSVNALATLAGATLGARLGA